VGRARRPQARRLQDRGKKRLMSRTSITNINVVIISKVWYIVLLLLLLLFIIIIVTIIIIIIIIINNSSSFISSRATLTVLSCTCFCL
jgi:hypothetical protein